ncbi:Acyl-coenzyme A thioesterase 13 [Balamuthia mandrillaris]
MEASAVQKAQALTDFFCSGTEYSAKVLQNVKLSFDSILPENNGLRFSLIVSDEVVNLGQNLHGGVTATLLDVLTSLALLTYDKKSRGSVSTNLSVDYISAAPNHCELWADCRVLKIGATLGFTEMELRRKDNNALVAKGSHTKFFLPGSFSVSSSSSSAPKKAAL